MKQWLDLWFCETVALCGSCCLPFGSASPLDLNVNGRAGHAMSPPPTPESRIAFRASPGLSRKSLRKSAGLLNGFGSQNAPKIRPKITKNPFPEPSRNRTPKNNTKYRAKPSQTLKIELPCERGASFHYFTLSKKTTKVVHIPLKSSPKAAKIQ